MYSDKKEELLQMIKVNNWKDLVDVLSSLDCEEYIKIQIGTNEIELFYDSTTDKLQCLTNVTLISTH